ncbi:DUF2339 domain-containing protein [Botryobacter ruber]|uniref:DUF2339 domain-containing protein n=1 Tax=Botryobacter ruber TaxID=2171629 RepID=UPI000E0C9B98|nr:DUF2339 domain-containing protein [Botryobacter ruber]
MEIFLLLILLILLWWFGNRILQRLDDRNEEVTQLRNEVRSLREQLGEASATTGTAAATIPAAREQAAPARPATPPVVPTPPPAAPRPAPVALGKELPLKEPAVPAMAEPAAAFSATPPAAAPVPPPRVVPPPAPPKPSFFERNPDWEKFVGENLINKIGIAILVLGIGFFVKYAIDQDWINEVGRVAIGILAGGALLGVAHRLRRDFKAFSSVLVGGGMAVLYFTIAIAFHEYQLFGQTAAFLLMVGITGFTIFLSVAYDRIELAVLALVGGFGSPFMVSTGEGNYVVLFTFVLILNLGILVLAYFKKWNLLHIIAYVFTIILYSGWLTTRVIDTPDPPYAGALFFATIFYLVFFLMNIINNIKERRQFTAPEIMMLLSNTFLYYAAGMYVLQYMAGGAAYKGLFTAAIAGFNFLFAYLLYRNRKADRNLVYLLIGLVLTFLSLVAPVQLEGNYITLFWALEAVLLLWLSQRSGISLIRAASVVVLALMAVSLLMDWELYFVPQPEPLAIILNKAFITGAVAVVALAATFFLLRREGDYMLGKVLSAELYRLVVGTAFCLFLYLVLELELYYQLDRFGISYSSKTFVIGFYNYLFVAGLLLYSLRLAEPEYRKGAAWLAVAAIVSYLVLLQPAAISARDTYLRGDIGGSSFVLHYLSLGLVLFFMWFVLRTVRAQSGYESRWGKVTLWFVSFVAVFLASAEMEHLVLLVAYEPGTSIYELLSQVRKIGFALVWGLSSFVLMYLGMTRKLKTLRIIALSLFALTLLKLFLFDIRGISEGGKIAAFICLGLILLVVSFMYQKLKVLILEDDKAASSDDTHAHEQPL